MTELPVFLYQPWWNSPQPGWLLRSPFVALLGMGNVTWTTVPTELSRLALVLGLPTELSRLALVLA